MSQSVSPPKRRPEAPAPPPDVELVAEPLLGFRAFEVTDTGTFQTVNHRAFADGPEHPAFCDHALKGYNERRGHDEAPAWDCTCGYYAVADIDWLDTRLWRASVDLWGTVVMHEHGWRAQYQQIRRIYAPEACFWCGMPASVLSVGSSYLRGWCGCAPRSHERVAAPAALLDDPRITWDEIDPAGPPPPTLAAEVAKLAKAVTFLGTSGRGVRPIPREVAAMVPAGTTTWVNDLQATNPVYRPQLCIEHHQEGWRMILLAPTGMIMWDTIIPYAAGPDPRFG